MSAYKKIMKFYGKSSIWTKLLLWVFVVFIIAGLMKKSTPVREGFVQSETFVLKEGPEVFDDFYASIYDDLVFSKVKNDFEFIRSASVRQGGGNHKKNNKKKSFKKNYKKSH